jgi:hypothetical protein
LSILRLFNPYSIFEKYVRKGGVMSIDYIKRDEKKRNPTHPVELLSSTDALAVIAYLLGV